MARAVADAGYPRAPSPRAQLRSSPLEAPRLEPPPGWLGSPPLLARVLIRPKEGIVDPQGKAVERALPALGFDGHRPRPRRPAGRARDRDPDRARRALREAARQPAGRGLRDRARRRRERVAGGVTTFGVLRFPGSCDEVDALLACERVGDARIIWHGTRPLGDVDAVVVPGGFSYGDYLRVGAIARFAPAMEAVASSPRPAARCSGICNGFQVLCEAGLLPGALLPNEGLRFLCRQVDLAAETAEGPDSPWTRGMRGRRDGSRSRSSTRPVAGSRRRSQLEPVWRATDRSSSATPRARTRTARHGDIAGVTNAAGNVVGLMPHPEHAVDALTGSVDGLRLFASVAAVPACADARLLHQPAKSATHDEVGICLLVRPRAGRRRPPAALRPG